MITSVIITKNEEKMLEACLSSIDWCDEIIIIDSYSKDKTVDIAKKFTQKIYQIETDDFSKRRNAGLSYAKGDWIFYLDADERVTEKLKDEILETIKKGSVPAYAIPRKNIMFGKHLKYGGWYPDYQTRLFAKPALKTWHGKLHETPEISTDVEKLKNPLIHLTHKNISETLTKKIEWSDLEALEKLKSNHPKISWPRIFKVMLTEFIKRYFIKSGWRDGTEGLIVSVDESISMFIIYTRLWEMQKNE